MDLKSQILADLADSADFKRVVDYESSDQDLVDLQEYKKGRPGKPVSLLDLIDCEL